MTRQRLGLIGAICLLALVGSSGTARALTVTTHYCGILVPAYTRCSSSAFGFFYYNEARYPGTGTVSVCERAETQSGILLSRFCHDNVAGSGGDLSFNCCGNNAWVNAYVGNNSDHRHTINGKAFS